MERAKNGVETDMVRGLERLGGFGGVADRLNEYNHYLGNPDYIQQDLARYQKSTIASIRSFAETQLKPNASVVVYGIPGKPDLGPDVPTSKTLAKGNNTGGSGERRCSVARRGPSTWSRAAIESPRSRYF